MPTNHFVFKKRYQQPETFQEFLSPASRGHLRRLQGHPILDKPAKPVKWWPQGYESIPDIVPLCPHCFMPLCLQHKYDADEALLEAVKLKEKQGYALGRMPGGEIIHFRDEIVKPEGVRRFFNAD